ncbi:MAG: efflux RND transporter periplasmic adaptor subunit [Calditrichaceae bacterium]|jgi:HlyD family secretion protein
MKKENSNLRPKSDRLLAVSILLCGIIFAFGCAGKSEEANHNNSNRLIPSVEAVKAKFGALPLTERLTGVVRAKNRVEIYPEISAVIMAVGVQNGDVVKKGQPLVHLRDKEFQERLRQAKANYQIAVAQQKQAAANLKEAQTGLKRTESLAEKGLASQAELEAAQTKAISAEADWELAKARVDQAHATVEERRTSLSETVIRAPVTGSVGNRNAEIGMLVSPNTRLFTLGQLDELKIEVVLTDLMLNYIETGQRTEIAADYLSSGVLEAPLSRISPFLNPVTHSTEAEIDLSNSGGRLKPGMFVTVDIYYGESEQATLIPLSALYDNPNTGVTGVYVSKDSVSLNREPVGGSNTSQSVALSTPVEFDFVEVDVVARGRMEAGVSGIEPGSWVVTLGQNLIGSASGEAKVRTVNWDWVENLQNLSTQDLLEDIMEKQQEAVKDSTAGSIF